MSLLLTCSSLHECADKDECASGTHNCDKNAACLNIDGGFTCTCNEGYSGDGVNCTGITINYHLCT